MMTGLSRLAGAIALSSIIVTAVALSSTATATPVGCDCQIPGSDRAYELVSPAEADGPEGTAPLIRAASGKVFGVGENQGVLLADRSNLAGQLGSALDVQANGSTVFWNAQHGVARSIRTSSGWSPKSLLPPQPQRLGPPGNLPQVLLGASADGSSALVETGAVLYPGAFANPQQASRNEWNGVLVYRVSADGDFSPQMVERGESLIPANKDLPSLTGSPVGPFQAISASPDLTEVAFRSVIALEHEDTCNVAHLESVTALDSATSYLWNAASMNGLAHVIYNFRGAKCTTPNVTDVPTILPDGRPVLLPNPAGNPGMPPGKGPGPLVENSADSNQPDSLTPLTGSSGGALLAATPDSATAYVRAADPLDPSFPSASGGNIYAETTSQGAGGPVTCISCSNDPDGPDQVQVTYVATSKDGSHVIFTTDQGLWQWDASDGARLLTSAADLTPAKVVVSQNGNYVIVLTSQPLSGADTNEGPDIYELGVGQAPRLISSGLANDQYKITVSPGNLGVIQPIAGVSDDGQRVVFNRFPADGSPEVIDEWIDGETTQLSPGGAAGAYRPIPGEPGGYEVQALAGAQLQDVFFIAHAPLVPGDHNAGQGDIYDARVDGGFPAPPDSGCEGDACQGSLTAAPAGSATAASQSFFGPGNPVPQRTKPVAKKCSKAKKLKKRKCMAHKAHRRSANHDRGGAR